MMATRIVMEVEHGKPGIELGIYEGGNYSKVETLFCAMGQATLRAQQVRRERGFGVDCDIEPTMSFRLRDYLGPNGRYPYERLQGDLEQALKLGFTVYLWSVPGFFMLSGHPDVLDDKPWSNGHGYFRTAKQALAA